MPDFDLLNGKSVLITGGTGSFGQQLVQEILQRCSPRRLVVFSRDELKQFHMQQRFSEEDHPCLRYFLGDVRDRNRLIQACDGVDTIIHAAALKQIVAAERNPMECIATNVLGAENVIAAVISNHVQRVIALSTDKAANPINLYGATKLCSDKLFIAANNLSGRQKTRFSVVRYGNVAGSRGSVIPYFKRLAAEGQSTLPVTHEDMTRFVITLTRGVEFVLQCLRNMTGGELFVPKLPSFRIVDLVPLMAENATYKVTGIRPGEKLHEVMIPSEESRNSLDMGNYYVIQPSHTWWNLEAFIEHVRSRGEPIPDNFEYASNTNEWWLQPQELASLVAEVQAD